MSFPPPKARMEPLPWQQRYLRGTRAQGDLKTERQYVAWITACGAQGAVQPLLPLDKEARGPTGES